MSGDTEWRAVPNFEGFYEISSTGLVKSLRRGKRPGRILRPGVTNVGYETVSLHVNGVRSNRYIHRLVLETFVGRCPDGMVACHNDGTRRNNHISNLRWDTISANHLDCHRHGTSPVGERSPTAKLTDDAVKFIRQCGWQTKDLVKKFGVTRVTIQYIRAGRTWRHITPARAALAKSRVKP